MLKFTVNLCLTSNHDQQWKRNSSSQPLKGHSFLGWDRNIVLIASISA